VSGWFAGLFCHCGPCGKRLLPISTATEKESYGQGLAAQRLKWQLERARLFDSDSPNKRKFLRIDHFKAPLVAQSIFSFIESWRDL
jgi:hypothetical protein